MLPLSLENRTLKRIPEKAIIKTTVKAKFRFLLAAKGLLDPIRKITAVCINTYRESSPKALGVKILFAVTV